MKWCQYLKKMRQSRLNFQTIFFFFLSYRRENWYFLIKELCTPINKILFFYQEQGRQDYGKCSPIEIYWPWPTWPAFAIISAAATKNPHNKTQKLIRSYFLSYLWLNVWCIFLNCLILEAFGIPPCWSSYLTWD